MCGLIQGRSQKNFPKSLNPPTHLRVFMRFGNTKGEIRVKKDDFWGDLGISDISYLKTTSGKRRPTGTVTMKLSLSHIFSLSIRCQFQHRFVKLQSRLLGICLSKEHLALWQFQSLLESASSDENQISPFKLNIWQWMALMLI